MPVTHRVEEGQKRLWTSAQGVVTYDDIEAHLVQEERDDALALAEVIDARGASTDLTSSQVRALVSRTDALGMVRLLVAAARQMPAYEKLTGRLPLRLRTLLAEARRTLRRR